MHACVLVFQTTSEGSLPQLFPLSATIVAEDYADS